MLKQYEILRRLNTIMAVYYSKNFRSNIQFVLSNDYREVLCSVITDSII